MPQSSSSPLNQAQRRKERERLQLERFRERWSDFPAGRIIGQEEPDFVVLGVDTVVGIELRNYYFDENHGSKSQRQESLRNQIIDDAVRSYDATGLPPVNVSVLWNDQRSLDDQSVQRLSVSLSHLVTQHLPPDRQEILLGYPNPTWKELPKEVAALWLDRFGPPSENCWMSQGGGAVPQVGVDDIRRALDAKERKIPVYRRSVAQRVTAEPAEMWLLVVAFGWTMSGFCTISPVLANYNFETSFDRLFFLQYMEGEVLELPRISR